MRVGVTGASGHIGNNLVRELLKNGHRVRVLVHNDIRALKGLNVEMVEGNILSEKDTDIFTDGLDALFHLAARIFIGKKHSKKFFAENTEGTKQILRAVAGQPIRLIHFSSVHAYDPFPLSEPLDETRPLVVNDKYLYNRSKAVTHRMVMDAFTRSVHGVILCPTAVLGPGDYKPSLLGEAVLRFARGKMPALIPGGYDWVDVRDVVKAAVNLLDTEISGEDFLLSGHWISLADLYKMIRSLQPHGKNIPVLPSWLARTGAPFMEAWAALNGREPLYTSGSVTFLKYSHRQISHQKATDMLEYHPRPFKETLADTLRWFDEHKITDV
ncbi:MAG: NAD-dependent epimerase/dehydratase family protein [Chlorobi bacterium]|nr:NAD-dependent epimerase/dehydratase family protein [Chlorobiota bacterium]